MTQVLLDAAWAFLLSAALTLAVREIAVRYGVVAQPREDRWHRRPTALLGGLAILATVAIGLGWLGWADRRLWVILAGGSVLSLVGLVDDILGLRPVVRLVVQLTVAGVSVMSGIALSWAVPETVTIIVSIFWLVSITNAVNLLDNMDGLAAGITALSSAFLVATMLMNGQSELARAGVILGAAAAGFLVFNFNPASIFMGDCGSTFLGFALGCIALLSTTGRFDNVAAVMLGPVLILLIPILDTTLVTITRKLSGRSVLTGGRDHLSHRLVALGVSERAAVLSLYAFGAASGALALVIRFMSPESLFVVVPAAVVLIVLLALHVGKVRVYASPAELSGSFTAITALSHFSNKRRFFEVLLDVVLIAVAYQSAYLLRFEDQLPPEQRSILYRSLPLVIAIQLPAFLASGVYSGIWRYAGLGELIKIGRGALVGASATAIAVFALYNFRGPSRSVFLLNLVLLVVLVGGCRLLFRVFPLLLPAPTGNPNGLKPALVYGAGDSGELLVRLLRNDSAHGFDPVGFLDDDDGKTGRTIHGCYIHAATNAVEVARSLGVNDVIVTSAKIPDSAVEALRAGGLVPRRLVIRIE